MKPMPDLFERIRVKPDPEAAAHHAGPRCEASGCEHPGTHRAPKGRTREGEYYCFCLKHVRIYNQSYNYFAGMSDHDVESYLKAAATGHRPTWTIGGNPWVRASAGRSGGFRFEDPIGVFGEEPSAFHHRPPPEEPRPVRNVARRSFDALNLDPSATAAEIKARFKELVKRHHPDANGGDRAGEDRLRAVIAAYNHLKAAGFCG